ncbi:HNH endonuclease [Candidatus Poseidonia alphae]|nr:HNH endonuclease [Candidatus Poseidonia alphae]
MVETRYEKEVTGICKICGAEGVTEMHHIISQSKIKKLDRLDLLTNPNNIIELCKTCHEWTDSSIYFKWYREKRTYGQSREATRLGRERKRAKEGTLQCRGYIKSGRRCEIGVPKNSRGYCKWHRNQIPKEQEKITQYFRPK